MSLSFGDGVGLAGLAIALLLWVFAPTPSLKVIAFAIACVIFVFLLCEFVPQLKPWQWGQKGLLVTGAALIATSVAWVVLVPPGPVAAGTESPQERAARIIADQDRADLRQKGTQLMLDVGELHRQGAGALATFDTGKPAQDRFFPGETRRSLEIRFLEAYRQNFAGDVFRFFERSERVYGIQSGLDERAIMAPNKMHDLWTIQIRIARVLNDLGLIKATGPGITSPELPAPTEHP